MNNVIKFPSGINHELDSAEMLHEIAKDAPKKVFVICWPEDGSMPTYHTNTADYPVIMMRLQHFIHKMYNEEFGDL